MMRNKMNTDKRSNSDSNDSNPYSDDQTNKIHQPKQQKPSITSQCSSGTSLSTVPGTSSLPFNSNRSGHHYFFNTNSIIVNPLDNSNDDHSEEATDLFPFQVSTNLSNSWKNAFQMSNIPDYFPQLPSMPSMPNISIPNLPSIPALTMPSMPNLSMPNITMPSMPNINFPSISDFMPFYLGKNIKSWDQICASVRESRKKFTSVCPSLPFNFNFYYDTKNEKCRLYFLGSMNSYETTLYYCDVSLLKDSNKNKVDEAFDSTCLAEKNTNDRQNLINEKFYEKNKFNVTNLENNFDIGDCDIDNDIDNNISSSSPTSMTLSSSSTASNDSFNQTPIDASMLGKSITSPTPSISIDTIEWKPLIKVNPNFTQMDSETNQESSNSKKVGSFSCKTSSQEEDLILQRKRVLISGISSYDFNCLVPRFVFTMKNAIYWFDDVEMNNNIEPENKFKIVNDDPITNDLIAPSIKSNCPPYVPNKLITNDHVKLNATICPYNSDLVAYTADNDLWVCDLISGCELRLTNTCYAKTAIMAGRPSFVMQEEFSRFNGFWWRPLGHEYRNVHTILCEFNDESMVESISISSWDGMNETHRFPKAGSINAKSTLKLVHFSYNSFLKTTKNRLRLLKIEDLRVSFETIFPEYEYLIRCDWLSDDVIWAQLLNRRQNHLVIVFLSIGDKFPAQIIHEESQQDHWYNCHEIFHFYPYQKNNVSDNDDENRTNCDHNDIITVGSKLEFLWSSEISGFRHLYKIVIEIVDYPLKTKDDEEENKNEMNDDSEFQKSSPPSMNDQDVVALRSKILEHRQLTNGNWEVSESMFWVDEKNDLIYFIGSKDSPLENHLYVVSSSQSSRVSPRRLSKEDYTHTRIVFDPKFNFCIDFQSNLTIPPFGCLHRIIYSEDNSLNINLEPIYMFLNLPDDCKVDDSEEFCDKVQSLGQTPQLFEYKLQSGELIYGFLFKPEYMEPGLKYPVLLEIYGGPEVQIVTKSFKDLRQHRRHLIASEGYIVVSFDSRGSKHRGVEFEKHIYKKLGQVEIDDQVEALQWLAENTGFIDMNRVAIYGWSFGGYLSLMALVKRPDIFKCAIAGAPVTNWFLYDTGYTERYMGLPSENEEAYKRSNVLTYVKNFPNEYNRLLIIHGLMDENVHFCHTAQLIQGLVMFSKPYSLNVYPYERHSLKKMHSSEHFEATLIYYLQQNL